MPADRVYDRDQRRKAEFIRPPHPIKAKVGHGGLNEAILERAQKLLELSDESFRPQAEMYISTIAQGIDRARKINANLDMSSEDKKAAGENAIAMIMYPAIQLRANGGLFNFPLISITAEKLIKFMEFVDEPDEGVLEIVSAFITTMRAVVAGSVSGDGGKYGQELLQELDDACKRYFAKRH